MSIVSRFAPSPTGQLHLGHAYSMVCAHDAARAAGGVFRLRIEDTDITRSRPEYQAAILDDMAWLGVEWDPPLVIQSQRLALYQDALGRLIEEGLAYPCFCSRADIAREVAASLSAPHGPDGPIYPGTCRSIPAAVAARRSESELHSWRLDAGKAMARFGALGWSDRRAGRIAVDPDALGDIILKGRDRPASYHLAVVVDDAAMGVTLVTRGMDLFASTHVQRILQALLGLPEPAYFHHALIVGPDGQRLAKRAASVGLDRLRADGIDGPTLVDDLRAGRLPIGFRLLEA